VDNDAHDVDDGGSFVDDFVDADDVGGDDVGEADGVGN
jgi:hypothetical protein